ncbi:MAG: dynamin family protein [Chloroflexi bacterium]|nr:dynamin family protein [Chloroflexota bacterium]
MNAILTPAQSDLLRDEKAYLSDLVATLTAFKKPLEELSDLRQALLQLDELFLIVVAGEFNAGKSALINALIGQRVLPEGVTPTTTRITLVKHGDSVRESVGDAGIAVLAFPLDLLRELNFVDTPGTNAVIREHEELTRQYVPRSDLVLFVTSADRPFTESERQFVENIREWGKKIVFVVNKRDLLGTEADLHEVTAFVAEHAAALLGAPPEIFPVSARRAQEGDEVASGMRELRTYVQSWLDESARLRVKFASPLGVADRILRQEQGRAAHERDQLAADTAMVATVEREMSTYETELRGELQARLAEVDNVLLRLQTRGMDFFDQKFRLMNLPDLTRGDRFRALFESQVLTGVSDEIDHLVQSTVNWLVEKDLRHWQQISSFMLKRRTALEDELVGQVSTDFDLRRQALLDSVSQSSQSVVATYDAEEESRQLGSAVESSVAQTALVEAGAVGLGTAVTILVGSSAVDVTGVLFAGVIAIVGFFIIPYKRQQAKTRFRDKIQAVRDNLVRVLTAQFNAETERTLNRLKEGVAPYFRFVRGEKERLDSVERALADAADRLSRLQARVTEAFEERSGKTTTRRRA